MVQLAITAAFIGLFTTNDATAKYFQERVGYVVLAFVVTIVCMLAMACCEGPRRTPPLNYIFLLIFTCAEGFLMGVISATFKAREVNDVH